MIVIITPPHTLPDEEHIVNKLFESGLHLLHLRKPGADRDTLEHYIRGIRAGVSGNVSSCTTTSNWQKSTG